MRFLPFLDLTGENYHSRSSVTTTGHQMYSKSNPGFVHEKSVSSNNATSNPANVPLTVNNQPQPGHPQKLKSKTQLDNNSRNHPEKMSLATLLRIQSSNISNSKARTNGVRKFVLSDIQENTSDLEDRAKEVETGISTATSSSPKMISPEEQEELDFLLKSLQ